ncbi:uncharacterized protein Z520_00647 [Fonsecaea multimorphosa CBS 102226]|uniref:FAS1 domain-containing protein n=1 Tax=Fonsecaea multimorphosa CBS 102226 TaxID=1442371 RepID=A0A0D2KKH3_9EURO|nr:uncharacterized protein Z520_00647 [Fonsecaea multimorphosa CBS 102226]KIY03955.1 hypothetical protein Z520_00647 [Fonsecaea multimorphosa CBS 102226]OAL31795.1 hypothetical protein AYO22_00665 [Fonsecaea multimorphosa]
MLLLTLLGLLLKIIHAVPEAFPPYLPVQSAFIPEDIGLVEEPDDLKTTPTPASFTFCPPVNHIPHNFPYVGPDYRWSNKTVLDILGSLEQTQAFADSLRPFQDLASRLSDPGLNSTVWAVADSAALPAGCQSHQALHDCLANHISPHWVPTIRELSMPNTPTLLRPRTLNGDARIHISVSSLSETATVGAALMVNRYSRVIEHDIMARNGVVHVVDAYLPLLQPMTSFIDSSLAPDQRGCHLNLIRKAVQHAEFAAHLEQAKLHGATFFAPDDAAFGQLDPRYLDFLFSEQGKGVLKTMLQGHLVPNRTLFSNAFYDDEGTSGRVSGGSVETYEARAVAGSDADSDQQAAVAGSKKHQGWYEYELTPNPESDHSTQSESGCYKVPWGRRQFCLPTLRPGMELTFDVARAGGFIKMSVRSNRATRVRVKAADFLCSDGIVHIVDKVFLFP